MKNIQAALQQVTVANGFSATLNSVERLLQDGQGMSPPMAMVIEGTDEVIENGPLLGATSLISRHLMVGVRLIAQQDTDVDARSASELLNGMLGDVQKKLQEDYRRGDLAINTEEVHVEPVQFDEAVPALYLDIMYRIHYRHSRVDPTVAG